MRLIVTSVLVLPIAIMTGWTEAQPPRGPFLRAPALVPPKGGQASWLLVEVHPDNISRAGDVLSVSISLDSTAETAAVAQYAVEVVTDSGNAFVEPWESMKLPLAAADSQAVANTFATPRFRSDGFI